MSQIENSSGLPLAKRTRLGISDAQKQALRAFWSNSSPRPTQRECVNWFQAQFRHQISRVSVSRILSSQYEHLDTGPAGASMRASSSHWPILDQKLSDWADGHINNGYPMTGALLQYKAAELWSKIPEYRDRPKPQFSEGWLTRFKTRHSLRYHNFHGEAASVPSSIHEDIKPIRAICDQYDPEDIYNMDETGLYWRQVPNGGLSKQKIAGQKRDKTRISLVVASNATGSDRVPLWLIGEAKTPRALRGVNVRALGCVWRHNDAAWMRHDIMEDWLRSFYGRISMDRRVLLLLDNASPHTVGVRRAPPPPRIKVVFFPSNATSIYQPLDQGIIQNVKHHYRKKWIRWMIAILDRGLDPREKMSIYYTLHWITQVWRNQVSDQTIHNCFIKSTLIGPMSNSAVPTDPSCLSLPIEPGLGKEIKDLYDQVIEKFGNDDIIPFDQFLNPSDESNIPEQPEDENAHVALEGSDVDDDYISGPPPELPSNSDVLRYLQDILLWVGNKEKGTQHHIRQIESLISEFSRIQIDEKRQVTFDDMGWKPK